MKFLEGMSFPIDIDERSGKIKTTVDNKVVRQSLNMILKTQIMEHKIFPDYGAELNSFMFEVVDSNYVHSFKKSIETAISQWEPHIVSMDIHVKANRGPISKIEASLDYTTDISPESERIVKAVSIDSK